MSLVIADEVGGPTGAKVQRKSAYGRAHVSSPAALPHTNNSVENPRPAVTR